MLSKQDLDLRAITAMLVRKREMNAAKSHGSGREYKLARRRWRKAMTELSYRQWAVDVLRGACNV